MPDRKVFGRSRGWQLTSVQTLAAACLALFLGAVVVALVLTVALTPLLTKLLAAAIVLPVIGVTLALLYLERGGRRWSYLGAAGLGVFGIVLRLIINSQPQLEVGGGLPLGVTIVYISLGISVIISSSLAFAEVPRTR